MWKSLISNNRFEGKIYAEGETFPEHFTPPESWINNGVVEKIETKRKKKIMEGLENVS
jgi:hypothetical protein